MLGAREVVYAAVALEETVPMSNYGRRFVASQGDLAEGFGTYIRGEQCQLHL